MCTCDQSRWIKPPQQNFTNTTDKLNGRLRFRYKCKGLVHSKYKQGFSVKQNRISDGDMRDIHSPWEKNQKCGRCLSDGLNGGSAASAALVSLQQTHLCLASRSHVTEPCRKAALRANVLFQSETQGARRQGPVRRYRGADPAAMSLRVNKEPSLTVYQTWHPPLTQPRVGNQV